MSLLLRDPARRGREPAPGDGDLRHVADRIDPPPPRLEGLGVRRHEPAVVRQATPPQEGRGAVWWDREQQVVARTLTVLEDELLAPGVHRLGGSLRVKLDAALLEQVRQRPPERLPPR